VTNPGLFQLMLAYLRELKSDWLQVLVSHHTAALLDTLRVSPAELHKLNDDQLRLVKQSLIDFPGHRIFKDIIQAPEHSREVSGELLKTMLCNLVDILAKKLPPEVNFNNSKLESVISRIKLVPIPKHIFEEPVIEDRYDENQLAIVRTVV
jgi:hypothetical protein